MNIKFVDLSSAGDGTSAADSGDVDSGDGQRLHLCDPEFSAHGAVTVSIITSHRVVAAAQPSYLRAGVHLLRANADVVPWMAALLAGVGEEGGEGVAGRGFWRCWAYCAGAAAAAVTLAVGCACTLRAICITQSPFTLQLNVLLPHPTHDLLHFFFGRIHVAPAIPLLLQVHPLHSFCSLRSRSASPAFVAHVTWHSNCHSSPSACPLVPSSNNVSRFPPHQAVLFLLPSISLISRQITPASSNFILSAFACLHVHMPTHPHHTSHVTLLLQVHMPPCSMVHHRLHTTITVCEGSCFSVSSSSSSPLARCCPSLFPPIPLLMCGNLD